MEGLIHCRAKMRDLEELVLLLDGIEIKKQFSKPLDGRYAFALRMILNDPNHYPMVVLLNKEIVYCQVFFVPSKNIEPKILLHGWWRQ